MTRRMFPIMGSDILGWPGDPIPWVMIAPYEAQALRYHRQSLEELAESGGLSPNEAVALLTGKYFDDVPDEGSVERLAALVETWEAEQGEGV